MPEAAKLFDPVLGVDIHLVVTPVGATIPMPHPFVGMVFDPLGAAIGAAMGAIFGGGGPVLINMLPCGNTGTEVKGIPHFPMPPGVSFAPNDIPSNDGTLVFGSKTVTMQGSSIARLTDLVMTCNFPINLPTSVCLAVPMGAPVEVGGPMAIDMMAAVTKAIRTKWFSDAMHRLTGGRFSKVICFLTGHPVDVMSGEVLTDHVEVELPGPIPLTFERSYYSRSRYDGPLGSGWTHPLDASLCEGLGELIVRLPDGRAREYPPLAPGASHWDDIERLTLERTAKGYRLHASEGLRYEFEAHEGAAPPRREELHPLRADVDHPTHRLARIVDRCGNAVTLRYAGRCLDEVIDSMGRVIRVRWTNDRRRWASLSVEGVEVVRYGYDAGGMLSSVTDADGAALRYAYSGGVLTQETNRNGLSFYFEYDVDAPEGWCVRTWGDGGIYDRRLTYDEARHVTLVDDSRGGRTHYFGNSLGLVERVIDPTGVETRYAYDTSCRKVAETDGLGHARQWRYDDRGNCVLERDPSGAETKRRFNDLDLPDEITDPRGGRWALDYDRRGKLERVVDPSGAEHHYRFDERGNLASAYDPLGRRFSLRYDARGAIAETDDWEGATTRFQWDALGRLTQHTDPLGRRVWLSRDGNGRVVAVRRDDGTLLERRYDGEGNVVEEIDALGHRTRSHYERMGRLMSRTDPSGETVRYAYDTEDELVAVINERGEEHRFELDLASRVVRELGFDGRTLAYRYDRAGRCVETVSGAGRVTRVERDASGRVVKRRVPSTFATPDEPVPPHEETVYRYDALGALVYAKNGDAEVTLERDPLGRVLRELVNGRCVESRYDAAGQRIARRTTDGHEAQYHVDGNGRLRGVTIDPDASWLQGASGLVKRDAWRMTVTRDAAGDEVERQLPGGVSAVWARDVAGRPSQQRVVVGGVASRQRAYSWEDDLRIAAIADSHTGTTRYQHDARAFLVAARSHDGTVQHRVADRVGNLYRTPDGSDRDYGRGGVLQRVGEVRYSHDADGQLTEKALPDGRRWRYAWDGIGQLREVRRPDGEVVRFAYDPLGRRVAKTFAGRTTSYVWDGDDLVHEVRDGATTTWVFEPDTFAPLAKLEGGRRYGVVCDHLGAPTELRDEAGALAWRAQLDLFGVANDDVMRTDCPWRWPGQYEDEETGLYYNRFRYYDPDAGRYVSQDPIGLEGGLAQYGYVHDPLAWLDPLGLEGCGLAKGQRKKLREIEELAENPGLSGLRAAVDDRQMRQLGEAFVGPGHTKARGKAGELWLISADEKRLFRSPTTKSSPFARTGRQANFHQRSNVRSDWFDANSTSNVHVHSK